MPHHSARCGVVSFFFHEMVPPPPPWGNRTVARAWRGHGAGVARAVGIIWLEVARAWRGHGAVARACPVPPAGAALCVPCGRAARGGLRCPFRILPKPVVHVPLVPPPVGRNLHWSFAFVVLFFALITSGRDKKSPPPSHRAAAACCWWWWCVIQIGTKTPSFWSSNRRAWEVGRAEIDDGWMDGMHGWMELMALMDSYNSNSK
eukprot:gene22537-biopygen23738